METIIKFLSELEQNNDREWFHAHKKEYQASRERFFTLIEEIIDKIKNRDIRLQDLSAKETVFRINRDVRFSKDKSPYKTHFGAYMAAGGRKSTNAGYYLHIEPNEAFLGAGVYQPAKEELNVIRQEILYQAEKYSSTLKQLEKKGFSMMERDKLKTGPNGFNKDSPHIELIKYKHYILSRNITGKELKSSDFADTVSNYFNQLFPYTDFLNTAMDFTGNE